MILIAIVTAALAAAPAGQTEPSELDNLRAMVLLSGSCERLVVAGRDASAGCHQAIVNLVYRNGRSSFAFTEDGVRMVSFSGTGQSGEGDEVSQTIDMVTVAAEDGRSVTSSPARGRCAFSNPYAGRSYVTCSAATAEGAYEASFTSDGRPPTVREFPE